MFWRDDLEAGKSAAEYYEKRLRAWRRSLRGPFVIAAFMAAGFAYLFSRWAPFGTFYAGMTIGSFGGMIVWMRDEPPHFIAKWKMGRDGERSTARALRPLTRGDWYATHDLQGNRRNLDHVVVGPGGVFLLESKNLAGEIVVDERGLTAVYGDASIDAFTNSRLSGAVTSASIDLRLRLAEVTDLHVFVVAAVVVWGEFAQGLSEHRNVHYIAGSRLRSWLEQQPVRLSPREVSLIRLALAAGEVAPPALPLDAVASS